MSIFIYISQVSNSSLSCFVALPEFIFPSLLKIFLKFRFPFAFFPFTNPFVFPFVMFSLFSKFILLLF